MQSFKRSAVLAVVFLLIATPCLADGTLKTIIEDAFYGSLSGALVGSALLAFTKHPGDHLDFIGYGAGTGLVTGAAYGALASSRSLTQAEPEARTKSLAEYNGGAVKFFVPTIIPELREAPGGQTALVATTEIFRGTF